MIRSSIHLYKLALLYTRRLQIHLKSEQYFKYNR